jgi:hypothetical protein
VLCALEACRLLYPGLHGDYQKHPSVDFFFWCYGGVPKSLCLQVIFEIIRKHGWCAGDSPDARWSPKPNRLLEADRAAERIAVKRVASPKKVEGCLLSHRPVVCTGCLVSDLQGVCSADPRSARECVLITGSAVQSGWLGWSPALGGAVTIPSADLLQADPELVVVKRRDDEDGAASASSSSSSWSDFGDGAHAD